MKKLEIFWEFLQEKRHCKIKREIAKANNQDLVLFNNEVNPKICKISDYTNHLINRFIFEKIKKNILLSEFKRGKIRKEKSS